MKAELLTKKRAWMISRAEKSRSGKGPEDKNPLFESISDRWDVGEIVGRVAIDRETLAIFLEKSGEMDSDLWAMKLLQNARKAANLPVADEHMIAEGKIREVNLLGLGGGKKVRCVKLDYNLLIPGNLEQLNQLEEALIVAEAGLPLNRVFFTFTDPAFYASMMGG